MDNFDVDTTPLRQRAEDDKFKSTHSPRKVSIIDNLVNGVHDSPMERKYSMVINTPVRYNSGNIDLGDCRFNSKVDLDKAYSNGKSTEEKIAPMNTPSGKTSP